MGVGVGVAVTTFTPIPKSQLGVGLGVGVGEVVGVGLGLGLGLGVGLGVGVGVAVIILVSTPKSQLGVGEGVGVGLVVGVGLGVGLVVGDGVGVGVPVDNAKTSRLIQKNTRPKTAPGLTTTLPLDNETQQPQSAHPSLLGNVDDVSVVGNEKKIHSSSQSTTDTDTSLGIYYDNSVSPTLTPRSLGTHAVSTPTASTASTAKAASAVQQVFGMQNKNNPQYNSLQKLTQSIQKKRYDDETLKLQYLYSQKYNDITKSDFEQLLKAKKDNTQYNGASNNRIEQINRHIVNYYNKIEKSRKDDDDILKKIDRFENDPKNPLEALTINFEDRLVFIIATFFTRYIAISIIQRGIDTNLITTFNEGIIYYVIIYTILFWFIVFFINIDNYAINYMDDNIMNYIRTYMFYFYMGTNGISHLLIHTLLLIVIIIIPIILNIKKKDVEVDDEDKDKIILLTYEERGKLSKLLSLITLFIWILTSIIATKF